MSKKYSFLLFDGRACGGEGNEDALVLVACDSDKEARSYAGDFGDMACYQYELVGGEWTNEEWWWDWYASSGEFNEVMSML